MTAIAHPVAVPATPQWSGSLELTFARREQATRVVRRRHQGPVMIQRPFYPEGQDCCHVYLLHPPGGLVGGDRLDGCYLLGDQTHGLITTPAAGKAYRVGTVNSEQGQHSDITVGQDAIVEWLPQESIIFNGAQLSMSTRFHLQQSSAVCGWEMLCFGRPAAAEVFNQGRVSQRLELWRDGRPLLLEHSHYQGDNAIMSAPWGLAGYPVSGSFFACWPEAVNQGEEIVQLARKTIDQAGFAGLCGASLVNGVLLVRGLGADTEALRDLFTSVWAALRPPLLKRSACPPRIWNT